MPAPRRFVCIHGHFYQPPRENPWLEAVETQDSAAPYHDWNERICAECYATNGAARIVNIKNKITRIVNNYARISFNFGPTLLSWLQENAHAHLPHDPRRREAQPQELQGPQLRHGAGLQPHHHAARQPARPHDADPLGHRRLPVPLRHSARRACGSPRPPPTPSTLELLAEHGIKFTVLAPHQCEAHSLAEATATRECGPTRQTRSVDTTRPYLVRFETASRMAVFFYDGPRSRAIAFEGLLNSGENFAARLQGGFKDSPDAQLVHVATDGESYGHHHKHGEMALAYALRLLEEDKTVKLINYGSFLAQFPPEYECEIVDNTSWSCAHGIERWRSNCGCNGGKPGWNQEWRTPAAQGPRRAARRARFRSPSAKATSSSKMCGPRAMPTSAWCSIAAKRQSKSFCASIAAIASPPTNAYARSS